jgi:hypothetical protein
MEPEQTPKTERELVAVFADRGTVDLVASQLRVAGLSEDEIAVDQDDVTALEAEMHGELSESAMAGPLSIVMPKEGMRGFAMVALIGGAIGLLLAVLLAFIDYGLNYWLRLLIAAGIVLTMTSIAALVLGPGFASKGSRDLMAAQRGITLRVRRNSDEVRSLLAKAHPIRLDEVTHDGEPVGTVMTETSRRESTLTGAVTETAENLLEQPKVGDPTDTEARDIGP